MRKAQVSLFIIIGIIIVIIAFLVMPYFLSMLKVLGSGSDSSPQSYITSCIGQELGHGLFKLGAHGGYFASNSTAAVEGYDFTMLGSTDVPGVNEIESQLDEYLDENAQSCVNGTGIFHGVTITASGSAETNVSVYEDSIIAIVRMPVVITEQDRQSTVNEFSVRINGIRIPEMLRYMNETVRTMEEGLGTDARLVDKNGFDVYYIPTGNLTVVDIIDPGSLVNSEPYEMSYAVQG